MDLRPNSFGHILKTGHRPPGRRQLPPSTATWKAPVREILRTHPDRLAVLPNAGQLGGRPGQRGGRHSWKAPGPGQRAEPTRIAWSSVPTRVSWEGARDPAGAGIPAAPPRRPPPAAPAMALAWAARRAAARLRAAPLAAAAGQRWLAASPAALSPAGAAGGGAAQAEGQLPGRHVQHVPGGAGGAVPGRPLQRGQDLGLLLPQPRCGALHLWGFLAPRIASRGVSGAEG